MFHLTPTESMKVLFGEGAVQQNTQHGFPVINTAEPDKTTEELIQQLLNGELALFKIFPVKETISSKDGDYTLVHSYKIVATDQTNLVQPPQYLEYRISKELGGLVSPWLVIPPRPPKETVDSVMKEFYPRLNEKRLQA